MSTPRVIQLVHRCPGRVRLRLPWLREVPADAERLADVLAGLDPSLLVEVRPWTGSVLCQYDPERLDADRVLGAVRRATKVAAVQRRGEPSPEAEAEYARAARARVGSLTRSISASARSLNEEVLRATDGRLDLGAATGVTFLAVGAAELATQRSVPAPPWFNLAWWAFRTFTLFGRPEDEEAPEPDANGDGSSAAGD